MLNNFIYAQTKALFLEQLSAGNIIDEAIVFIEDTREIWNHGTYFGGIGTELDSELIYDIQVAIAELDTDKLNKDIADETYAKKDELPNLSPYVTKDLADSLYATIGLKEEVNLALANKADKSDLDYLKLSNIPTAVSAFENDTNYISSNDIKTINGESIIGNGNIVVSATTIPIVKHGTSDTTFELTPNVVHKWDSIDNLILTLPEDGEGISNQYKAVFTTASDSFSLSLPFTLRWVNDTIPTFEAGLQYEISIEGRRLLWAKFGAELPAGDLLTYIESDGEDYILTDIVLNNITGVQIESAALFEPSDASSGKCIAGTSEASVLEPDFALFYRTGTRSIYWNKSDISQLDYWDKGEVKYDACNSSMLSGCTQPLAIFGLNNGGNITNIGKFQLYNIKMVDISGKPVIDLVPYRLTSTGAIGLLDSISGNFYPSVNGNLSAGSVIPVGFEPLLYIENTSDGETANDHIITDILINDQMYGVNCKVMPLFDGLSRVACGVGSSSSTADTSMALWCTSSGVTSVQWGGSTISSLQGTYSERTIVNWNFKDIQNTSTSTSPISIFGLNNNGTVENIGMFRFYYLQLLDVNGNPIVDLRPYRRLSDNSVGVMDTITNTFYTGVNGNLTYQS